MKIRYHKPAVKSLYSLSSSLKFRIIAKIESLKLNPHPYDSKKLKKENYDLYRVKVSNYRIIYEIEPSLVRIKLIGKRSTIYRDMSNRFREEEAIYC